MTLKCGIFDWVEASETLSPREIYLHKLELAEAADRAGLYGYHIAEHQGTPLSVNGSPSVLLSAMFQRTQKLRAGALNFCLPWYNPYRFYEEVCMLDQMSVKPADRKASSNACAISQRFSGSASRITPATVDVGRLGRLRPPG